MKLTPPQLTVLRRLFEKEYPEDQPDSSETYSADALIRRRLIKHVQDQYRITPQGRKFMETLGDDEEEDDDDS